MRLAVRYDICIGTGDDLDLSRTGNSYTKNGPFPTLETFSLEIRSLPLATASPGRLRHPPAGFKSRFPFLKLQDVFDDAV